MAASGCCTLTENGKPRERRLSARGAARWGLPSLILALMPKCPMCVVAYIALVTGVEVSVGAVGLMRLGMVMLCVGVLGFLSARVLRSAWHPRI
jgi:hypothetical protein